MRHVTAIGAFLFFSACFVSFVFAKETPEFNNTNCVLAIIGEADKGNRFECMSNVAVAIRNRGTLKGVNGATSERVKNGLYSAYTLSLAEKAWKVSKTEKSHPGQYWGSKTLDKDWIQYMRTHGYKKVAEDELHEFYYKKS